MNQLVIEFLNDVWPKQLSVRSEATSEALIDLALACVDCFPDRYQAVSQLVSPIKRDRLILPTIREEDNPIVKSHPEYLFRLMGKILPESVQDWPYGIEEMMSQLLKSEPNLIKDPAYLEVRRRWDSR